MKTLNYTILTLLSTIISVLSFGQTLKTIKPTIGYTKSFSKQEQLEWESIQKVASEIGKGKIDYEKLTSKQKLLLDSLESGDGPITQIGCNWYCGGEMYKVTSSSYLKTQGNSNYSPDNIHDFDLMTAWVPDASNGIIGEKVNFLFRLMSPRVNEIIIYNGYIKNYDLFRANSRVKKFKLYINDVYYATLELDDTTAGQSFKIFPVQSKDKNKDLKLSFEITEIYKGDKYEDVAVSEINFSGLDVH